ncbi:hypothetical protein Hanom_Chr12g01118281 [Helianthus anomalus]
MEKTAPAAYAIRDPSDPEAPIANPTQPRSAAGTGCFGGSRVILEIQELAEGEDSDPEIRNMDRSLNANPSLSSASFAKGKEGTVVLSPSTSDEQKSSSQKRKGSSSISLQINTKKHHLYLPEITKKAKTVVSSSSDLVLKKLDEHLTGGKSSKDEAPKMMSGPSTSLGYGG